MKSETDFQQAAFVKWPFKGRVRKIKPLFIATVIVPTLIAFLYFGLIASSIFVSESHYVVRTQGRQAPSGLASLLIGDSGALSGSAMSSVGEYVISRDAMTALNKDGKLLEIFTRPEIDQFGRIKPLGGEISQEALYSYFKDHVAVNQDTQNSITTLVVKAYRPEDARWINERLLELGEALVNRLNQRSREDLVRYARRDVEEAKAASRVSNVALAQYRNSHAVIDPEKEASASIQMVSKLQDQLIQTRTQLNQLRAFAQENPQIPVLENRVASLDREIDREMGKVAGGQGSLADKTAEYTRVALEAEYAEKLLSNALISLQNAHNDARRQQAYVERIVQPNLPDQALLPRRLRSIFSVFVLGLVAWGLLTLLFSAMREHNL